MVNLVPLAQLLDNSAIAAEWLALAEILKPNLEKFWDPAEGLYMDNLNAPDLHPQDGNSLACWFGIVDVDQAVTIYYKFMVRAAASVDWSILTE